VTRNHPPARLASILAVLLLCAASGSALADPYDGGATRERGSRDEPYRHDADGRYQSRRDSDQRAQDRWNRDARGYRGEHADRDGDRDAWRAREYRRDARDHSYWRGYDYPRYGYGNYGYGNYGYGNYGYGYPGGYYGYPRRYRHDDGSGDDAALTIAGGVIGGLIGNNAASPENRAAGTVFGALIGGVLGHAIGQSNNDDHRHGWSRGYGGGDRDERRYRHDDDGREQRLPGWRSF
jgi:hypothetical protein